jgi:ATP-dependent DNA helicase DinG
MSKNKGERNVLSKKSKDVLDEIFREILPKYNYSLREGQIELAHQMLTSLQNRKISLCEAEVGTGKTHAYIISAIIYSIYNSNFNMVRETYPINKDYYKSTSMPVVITTSSIALQNAIINDYIPEISRILLVHKIIETPISAVVRKGKTHFVCDVRLFDYLDKVNVEKEAVIYSELFKLSNADIKNIDLHAFDDLNEYIKRRICVPEHCNSMCSQYKECRYWELLHELNLYEHDIQICNHGLFLADVQKRTKMNAGIIPNYQAVIIDEAHKILESARQSYGISIEQAEFEEIADTILSLSIRSKSVEKEVLVNVENILITVGELFENLANAFLVDDEIDDMERYKVEIKKSTIRRIKLLIAYFTIILKILENKHSVIKHQRDLCYYAISSIENICERLIKYLSQKDYIHWLEIDKEVWNTKRMIGLYSIPKNLDALLYQHLWDKKIPIILTSGTLSVGGDFEYIKRKFGISFLQDIRLDEITKKSPFNYLENMLIFLNSKLPFPDNKDQRYIKALSAEIERLIIATHGHTAILFTSYKVMELVYIELLNKIDKFPLIIMNRGTVNSIDTFKNSKNGVLFAAGSCWEGIDIPGDILSSLIVVKLPFPTPDPISEYEESMYEDKQQYKRKIITAEMLIKLKQGSGRLIRHENDTGVLVIIDSRLKDGGFYRRKVIEALPDCRLAGSIKDIENFIQINKSDEYFL